MPFTSAVTADNQCSSGACPLSCHSVGYLDIHQNSTGWAECIAVNVHEQRSTHPLYACSYQSMGTDVLPHRVAQNPPSTTLTSLTHTEYPGLLRPSDVKKCATSFWPLWFPARNLSFILMSLWGQNSISLCFHILCLSFVFRDLITMCLGLGFYRA